jgi:hypothetical protein
MDKERMKDLNNYCMDCGKSTTIFAICKIPCISREYKYKNGVRHLKKNIQNETQKNLLVHTLPEER